MPDGFFKQARLAVWPLDNAEESFSAWVQAQPGFAFLLQKLSL